MGISVDSPEQNKAFAESLGASRTVSRAYGILIPILRLAKRATFVVDRQGVIRFIYRGGEAANPELALVERYFETQG